MFRNQDITSRKASFNDLEAIFHDPFCSATGSDELDAGAIGSRIDGPEVVGVGGLRVERVLEVELEEDLEQVDLGKVATV